MKVIKIARCSFCGKTIEPGTGITHIKKDGHSLNFCSSKCKKNLLKLKRKPIHVKWTKYYKK